MTAPGTFAFVRWECLPDALALGWLPVADIARRMRHAFDGEDGRKRAIVKARGQADYSAGPLFADQGCGA